MENSKIIINNTINDYNSIADKFSSTRDIITDDLKNIASEIDKTQSILDYGCGNGRMAELFDHKNYLGVDASKNLIDIATKKHPKYKFKLINPCQVNTKYKFENIICLAVIHHFPDIKTQKKLISDFFATLTSGGSLTITTWNKKCNRVDKMLKVPFKTEKIQIIRDIYCFTQNDLEKLVIGGGFYIKTSSIVIRNRGQYSNIEIRAVKPI